MNNTLESGRLSQVCSTASDDQQHYLQKQREAPGKRGKLQNCSDIHSHWCDEQDGKKPVTTGPRITAATTRSSLHWSYIRFNIFNLNRSLNGSWWRFERSYGRIQRPRVFYRTDTRVYAASVLAQVRPLSSHLRPALVCAFRLTPSLPG